MASYELRFKQSVAKDLRQLPSKDLRLILARIDLLRSQPRPIESEQLSDHERYRVRQGGYRIIYEIKDQELIIIVVKVGHRREVYRRN